MFRRCCDVGHGNVRFEYWLNRRVSRLSARTILSRRAGVRRRRARGGWSSRSAFPIKFAKEEKGLVNSYRSSRDIVFPLGMSTPLFTMALCRNLGNPLARQKQTATVAGPLSGIARFLKERQPL